jgi:hypothetical protein
VSDGNTLSDFVPFDVYRQLPGINWSRLKHMGTSPLHYHHGLTAADQDSPGKLLGRVAHLKTLEPGTMVDHVAVYHGEGRRGSKEWKAFAEANPGKDLIKAGEEDNCDKIAFAVRNHPLVLPLLEGSRFEVTAEWVDEATGLRCKARPDWLQPTFEGLTLIDLKTTTNLDSRFFQGIAGRMRYFGQLAHYSSGIKACTGAAPVRWLIVAVEAKPPFDVAVFEVPSQDRTFAEAEAAELLGKVKACEDADRWPGRYESIQPLEYPTYLFDKEMDIQPEEAA